MNPSMTNLRCRVASVLLACLILGTCGSCKGGAPAPTTSAAGLPTGSAAPVTTAPKSSLPTTTPKLMTVAINLTIATGNDYAGYTLPIYLRKAQTLHLNWKAEGSPFQMVATTPSGKVVSVRESGLDTAGQPAALPRVGEIRFFPADPAFSGFDWGTDGYYTFVPSIGKGSLPTKITVNYWIQG
jgi:hypothetical protein